ITNMTSTRPNQHPWVIAYQNAPPPACATLRALANTVEYGLTCVFAEEDGDPLPDSINTACLPWATSSVPSSAFYSPATACPTSWTAVATHTAAEGASDWIDGETALQCCPSGFVGGSGGMCNPGTSGSTPVLRCGEADAEENENLMYTAGSWPASVSARVTAVQLRYQQSDVGLGASATRTVTPSTSTRGSSPGDGSDGGGLSTGAKAAIGTVIPLILILGALAAFLLWRRRKHKKAAAAMSKDFADGHETKRSYDKVPQEAFSSLKGMPAAVMVPAATVAPTAAAATQSGQHEMPEWNAELDATEAERRRYMAVQGSFEASELGGIMRVNRKPITPVELDSTSVTTELDGSGSVERR
ncbi:hypothetical protein BU25DRAFT_346255, partial [Macroventuria anomochaeta]